MPVSRTTMVSSCGDIASAIETRLASAWRATLLSASAWMSKIVAAQSSGRSKRAPSVRQRTVDAQDREEHRARTLFAAHTGNSMNITLSLAPLVSLIAGILILAVPRMLNYIVAGYLILAGVLGIFGDIRLR
jgi:hypothetical protein